MSAFRVGVLVSGRGTNLAALLAAAAMPGYPAQVVLVCSNREAPALEHARRAGIGVRVFPRDRYADRAERDAAMTAALRSHAVELVVCAGYDAILAHGFVRAFEGRIINLHPSLLPAFAGWMDAPARALRSGVQDSGCTVHVVAEEVDSGPILAQRVVPIQPDDTPQTLHARIQAEEHRLLPEVVRQIAEGRLRLPA